MGHYPYKVEKLRTKDDGTDVWWPVSSNAEDPMVIGDGIPGDKKSAELMARCCNIAYKQALEDVKGRLLAIGVDASELIRLTTGPTARVYGANDEEIWVPASVKDRLSYGLYGHVWQWYIRGVDGTLAQLGQRIPSNIVDVIAAADAKREEYQSKGDAHDC